MQPTISDSFIEFPDGRMSPAKAAVYLDKTPKTLASWRSKGIGPKFTKMGRVYYFKQDLDRFIRERSGYQSASQARLK